jgi:hypothetical protein
MAFYTPFFCQFVSEASVRRRGDEGGERAAILAENGARLRLRLSGDLRGAFGVEAQFRAKPNTPPQRACRSMESGRVGGSRAAGGACYGHVYYQVRLS